MKPLNFLEFHRKHIKPYSDYRTNQIKRLDKIPYYQEMRTYVCTICLPEKTFNNRAKLVHHTKNEHRVSDNKNHGAYINFLFSKGFYVRKVSQDFHFGIQSNATQNYSKFLYKYSM
jgi:hypothetical protein